MVEVEKDAKPATESHSKETGAARQKETEQSHKPKWCIAHHIGSDADHVRKTIRDAP